MLVASLVLVAEDVFVAEAGVFPLDAVAGGQVLADVFVFEHRNLLLSNSFSSSHDFFLGEECSGAFEDFFYHGINLPIFRQKALAVEVYAELCLVEASIFVFQRFDLYFITLEIQLEVCVALAIIRRVSVGWRVALELDVGSDSLKRWRLFVHFSLREFHFLLEEQLGLEIFFELGFAFFLSEVSFLLKIIHLIDQLLLVFLIFLVFLLLGFGDLADFAVDAFLEEGQV